MSSYIFDQKPSLDDLEHFGVKGMKWGVRKQRPTGDRGGKSEDEKSARRRRAAQIAVVAGVVVAGAIIAHRSGVRVDTLRDAAGSAFQRGVPTPRLGSSTAGPRIPNGPFQRGVPAPRLGSPTRSPLTANPFGSSNVRVTGQGRAAAQQTLRRIGQQRFSAIPMPPVPVARPMPPVGGGSTRVSNRFLNQNRLRSTRQSQAGDIAAVRRSIAETIRGANADLRTRDNALNIPFNQRSYIPEWND